MSIVFRFYGRTNICEARTFDLSQRFNYLFISICVFKFVYVTRKMNMNICFG